MSFPAQRLPHLTGAGEVAMSSVAAGDERSQYQEIITFQCVGLWLVSNRLNVMINGVFRFSAKGNLECHARFLNQSFCASSNCEQPQRGLRSNHREFLNFSQIDSRLLRGQRVNLVTFALGLTA
jgi:hypothetical protein